MSTVYLVRHTPYANPLHIIPGRLPVALSEEGQAQAQILQQFFADKKISQIYSSPVHRCQQTVAIISDNRIAIKADLRLAETFSANQGITASSPWRRLLYKDVELLGGESQQQVQKRMVDFWQSCNFEQNRNYLICSHGDPLYFLYLFLINEQNLPELDVDEPPGFIHKGGVVEVVLESNKVISVKHLDNALRI